MELKGLIAEIYRGTYDSKQNVMHGKQNVTIIDEQIDEIFTASEQAPPVRIVRRNINGTPYIHAEPIEKGCYQFGGTYITCSDSRIRALNKYPIPLHDRVE
jgi:hypothetical protein